jgi:hypothetical protein
MTLELTALLFVVLAFVWITSVAVFGTVMCVMNQSKYCSRTKRIVTQRVKLSHLIGEMSIAGILGVVTYTLCSAAQIDPLITSALAGTVGHAGARSLICLELYLKASVER